MSYYHAKRTQLSQAVIAELEMERRVNAERSRSRHGAAQRWIEAYRAGERPFGIQGERVAPTTRFDWRGKTPAIHPVVKPINPQEKFNGTEIEGEFTVLADADASSNGGGEEGQQVGSNPTAGEGSGHPARQAEEGEGFDTPF